MDFEFDFDAIWGTLVQLVSTFGIRLLGALVILFLGLKIIKWIRKRLPSLRVMSQLDASVRSFLTSTLAVVLYAVLFITAAMIMGIPTTSFIAALASCFAAVGLAMQGSLSNFAGGLMLLMFKPFRVGDYISAPGQSVEGTVQEITVVYTVLRTYDGIEVTIPNGQLTNSVIKNIGAAETRRVDLSFRADPATPLEKLEALLNAAVAADARILPDPAPSIVLMEITDSAIVYGVRVWCPGSEYWNVRFDLNRTVKVAFDESGVIVPHQQVDVHMAEKPEA